MTNPYVAQMRQWRQTLTKDQRWAILISADPDALASALALKRIMAHRVRGVDIFRINEVTRPDNLAMIRYLRIPAKLWQPEKADLYTNFAMVDSQPHHNPAFQGITFDLIIDHHPLTAGQLPQAPFCDIRPGFGATSTMMTRYLQGLRIKPGPLLSTALLYGIRTDTATFERSGGEDDLSAYQWLIKHADATLLRRIIRSEYLRAWLPLFSRAFRSLRDCRGGAMVWLNEVDSADLLVSKPGGISITEAACKGVPMLLADLVGGCETRNQAFFAAHGWAELCDTSVIADSTLSLLADNARRQALAAVNDLMRAYKMLDLKLNDTLLNNIMILGLQHAVYPLEQDADTEKWEIP